MKFRTNKFLKDRDKSKERSKNGELKLIEHKDGRDNIKEIITNMRITIDNFSCKHLDDISCNLPFVKRMLPECKNCPIMK